ncbi:MAG: M16 family metallopeptidase [Vicinamibacterales bacterium]
MTIRIRAFVLALLTVTAVPPVWAQQPSQANPAQRAAQDPLTAVIAVTPEVRTGRLPNGLEYYVRSNGTPRGRAELRLVVNAGSVLEDENQRGLAHFVEHMAFNGTTNFPGGEIPAFIQRLGMRFGAHVNAHTSFDETVYQLQIPTDNPAIIDRSILILEDWAHGVTFDKAEVDKERGVVLEEWRLGLGAESRIRDAQMPVLLKGARYADRSPIGRPEILQSVTPEQLRQFYTDWYRPDLMAVIAVGDFDAAVLEQMIVAHFRDIPRPTSARPRPLYTVPPHGETLYSLVADREARGTLVNVYSIKPAGDQRTVGTYRQQMVERLFGRMLSARFAELADGPNPPFLAAETNRGLIVKSAVATNVVALVPDGTADRGLQAIFTEVERVIQHGFTQTELDREKSNSLHYLDEALADKDKSPSGPLADELVRHVIQDEPVPGIVYEQAMAQRFLPGISLAEINALAKNWIPEGDRVVAITAPERPGLALPTQARLASAIFTATNARVDAYVDRVSTQPLIAQMPTPGTVTRTTTRPEIGVTEWQLSNGAKVVLKPTTVKEDEILFRAYSPGGTSLAPDQDIVVAETADEVVAEGGLGAFSRIDLTKALAGANAAVRADIGDADEGLRGGSAKKDVERMFQLIYLNFTAPRADPGQFEALKARLKPMLANQQSLPEATFRAAITAALTQDNPRARPLTPAAIDQMNLERSVAFYRNRFADASDFTFVFVGSFDVQAMKPLVEKYLASLPSLKRTEAAVDRGIRPPTTVVEREVVKGVDPRSQVAIVFAGTFQNTPLNRLLIKTMGEMLGGNLHHVLREELGGTYGVNVDSRFSKFPTQEYQISIGFSCDPARVTELTDAAWNEIRRFAERGPSADYLAGARNQMDRDLENGYQENADLLNDLLESIENGEDVGSVFNKRALYDQMTVSGLRAAAAQFLTLQRYVQVTLRPESR